MTVEAPRPDWAAIRGLRASIPDEVVYRVLEDEAVALDLRSGVYHGLDRTATRFYLELRTGMPLEAVATVLARVYGQPIERIAADLTDFCRSLERAGLLELSAG